MTNDERISAYIDNELTGEQEQELLISLAASDSLRKSFRSELVLKKVMHADERGVNPPRHLRTAIFATIGLGAVTAATADAEAATVPSAASAPTHGLLKTLFASKINALLTAAGLTVAGLAGYGVHSITAPTPIHQEVVIPSTTPMQAPVQVTPAVTPETTSDLSEPSHTAPLATRTTHHRRVVDRAIQQAASANKPMVSDTQAATGIAGGGQVTMNPIVVKKTKK